MLTENEKRRMSAKCGWSKEQRTDDIKKGIMQSPYDRDKESAIKRHAIKVLIDIVVYGKPVSEVDFSEFLKYDNDIESIKEEVDKT